MAKRQNFVVGSTNSNIEIQTDAQLNHAWDSTVVLHSNKLNGVFNAVSDYSNDSSNEIANAIVELTGSQPTGSSQRELAQALHQMREDIETSSLTFIGYISSTEPSSSDYDFQVGNIWIQSASLPTTFPVAIAGVWNGTQWETTTDTYTQKDFDFFRNVNDNEGYYWFGGQWVVMSTDMSTTYFTLNQTSGKWEIKSSVNLPGAPTVATPTASSPQTQIANKEYVDSAISGSSAGRNVGDIFFTSRTDNELNGAVECNGATYNTTDFTGAQSIGALLEAGKIDYISLTAYADAITQKGWCDKIGWNGTGNTQFRVPTLTAYMAQKTLGLVTTTSVNHVGGSVAMRLGTTNSSSAVNRGAANPICTYGENGIGTNQAGGSWGGQNESLTPINLVVDASEDMSEQRVMIQLAISATDEALETCTGVLADVAALKYDYVVDFQRPTAQNNYTWYRKYKSGWVEQGGRVQSTSTDYQEQTITFPVEMADIGYMVTITPESSYGNTMAAKGYSFFNPTTTSMKVAPQKNTITWGNYWKVEGMAAS